MVEPSTINNARELLYLCLQVARSSYINKVSGITRILNVSKSTVPSTIAVRPE